MKRPVKATHKPHMSRARLPFARSPDADHARRADRATDAADEADSASGTGVVGIAVRCPSQASERVFAAVRPGFVAPCMVEAAGRAGGPFGGPRGPVWSALAAVPTCLPNTANPSRAARLGPRPHGLMAGDPDVKQRASRNRQREYLAESRGIVRQGVRCIAAITARESTDAQDLRLATLSSRMHVRSNIFKFVMT
jgi:hypothetical protein